jgi:hypothetical protein
VNDEALEKLKTATADYRAARDSLSYHRGLAKHGMRNDLASAVMAEHSAHARWIAASAVFTGKR